MNPDLSPLLLSALNIAFVVLGLCFFIAFIRLVKGPSLPDRVVALDLMAALAVGIIALYSIVSGRRLFIDVAIALALIAFLSTVAFSSFLMRRRTDDA